jgi:hypothetical protein
MPSRRKRLATLRMLGSQPTHVTDEPNEYGMDASTSPPESDRDAVRPRSAPTFCRPQPVPPKPFREANAVPLKPPARTRGTSIGPTSFSEHSAMPSTPRVATASAYERRYEDRPAAAQRNASEGVRPLWDTPVRDEPESDEHETPAAGPAWASVGRGVGLLFGTLIVIDVFAPHSRFSGSLWWLDLRPLPTNIATGFLGTCAAVLVAFAARASLPKPIKLIATVCVCLMIAVALKDATIYYGLLKRGDLHSGPPVAFSLHIAACLAAVLFALCATPSAVGVRDVLLVLLGFNAALVSLPIAQIACLGPIDGRRSAAAAIVFAPRTFEPGESFEGRAHAAVELYKEHLVPRVLIGGSAKEEDVQTLKRLVTEAGLDASAVQTLPKGDIAADFAWLGTEFPAADDRVPVLLAVSDVDHLPRVQMEARRAGVKLATVPTAARAPRREVLLREMLELWRLYFRR